MMPLSFWGRAALIGLILESGVAVEAQERGQEQKLDESIVKSLSAREVLDIQKALKAAQSPSGKVTLQQYYDRRRADFIGKYGQTPEATPGLSWLPEKGIKYPGGQMKTIILDPGGTLPDKPKTPVTIPVVTPGKTPQKKPSYCDGPFKDLFPECQDKKEGSE